jgi:hypothetical protein
MCKTVFFLDGYGIYLYRIKASTFFLVKTATINVDSKFESLTLAPIVMDSDNRDNASDSTLSCARTLHHSHVLPFADRQLARVLAVHVQNVDFAEL